MGAFSEQYYLFDKENGKYVSLIRLSRPVADKYSSEHPGELKIIGGKEEITEELIRLGKYNRDLVKLIKIIDGKGALLYKKVLGVYTDYVLSNGRNDRKSPKTEGVEARL